MEINIKLEIGRLFDTEAFDEKIRLLHQVISLLEIEREHVTSRKTQWKEEMKEIHDFKKKESVLKKKESVGKVKGKAKNSSDVASPNKNVFVSSIGIEDLAHDEEEL
jgi:flagellar biosynthesis/type III secretory pathway chaperone